MHDQSTWKKVLSELQLEVSPAVFNTMFKQTRLSQLSDGVATVTCISAVIAQLVETRYYTLVKRALSRQTEKDISIIFTVDSSLKSKRQNGEPAAQNIGPLFQAEAEFSIAVKKYGLRQEYTFDTLAVSTTNQLAFAAASHVGKHLGDSYNPLFLYGGVGVGKTHLMQAIAHESIKQDPSVRVVYCAGEDFTNEIVEAIKTRTTASFRNKFRRANLLCIDDVQFIAGKVAVQEEFFHTFNAVLRDGGQIVLTSDKAPSEILRLEARLKSRLEGGLLVDIAPPDFELRTAIFLIKARAKGLDFPVSLAKIIATTITDTRGLEGILTRILSEIHIKNASLSEELILRLLGKDRGKETNNDIAILKSPSKDAFIDAVCAYFEIKPTHLKGRRRDQSIVYPRQVLMYLLRTELGVPLAEVGNLIGGRDHTTVIHGVEKLSSLIGANEKTRGDILGIKKLVYG